LSEDRVEPAAGDRTGGDQVAQNIAGADARKLVGVADQHQRDGVGQSLQKLVHEPDVDHRGLVQDETIAAHRIVEVEFETADVRIELQQAMNGLGFTAGCFRHALRGAAGRGGKTDVQFARPEDLGQGADDRGFADTRAAGDNRDFRSDRVTQGLALQRG